MLHVFTITGLATAAVLLVACTAPTPTPTPTATPEPTPTLTPTPTVTPTPPDCPREYERELRRHPSMTNEEARSYRPTLSEPGVTIHQMLCDDALRKLAQKHYARAEEVGGAEGLGRELAQLYPRLETVSRAFRRWYIALPDSWYPKREWGPASSILVEFRRSHHGYPATVLIVEGKEGLTNLSGLLERRYGKHFALLDISGGAGEVIVCPSSEKNWIFHAMTGSAAARGLGIDDPWEERLFCKPGVF